MAEESPRSTNHSRRRHRPEPSSRKERAAPAVNADTLEGRWGGMQQWLVAGIAFLLGFLAVFNFNVIGVLGLNEVFLVAIAPFFAWKMYKSRTLRRQKWVLWLGLIYLAAQMGSDWYRGSVPQDYLRGWSRIAITILTFCIASALFVRNTKAVLAFIIGAFLVGPISFYQQGAIADEELVYKMSFGLAVSLASFLLVTLVPSRLKLPMSAAPVLAGVFALWRGGRGLAGITVMAVVTYWAGRIRAGGFKRLSRMRIFQIACVVGVAGWGIFETYRYTASHGILGEAALEKYELQAKQISGSFSVVSGRQEVLFSGPKIMASPIVGWGSWPKDFDYVYDRAVALGLELPSAEPSAVSPEVGLIPSHSHFFTAWLEAGVAGGCFWGVAVYMAVAVLLRQKFHRHEQLAPILNYLIVLFLWDVFFSPYSGERRVWNGVILAVIAATYYKNKDETQSSPARRAT